RVVSSVRSVAPERFSGEELLLRRSAPAARTLSRTGSATGISLAATPVTSQARAPVRRPPGPGAGSARTERAVPQHAVPQHRPHAALRFGEDGDVGERVAVHHDQVGAGAGAHRADLA